MPSPKKSKKPTDHQSKSTRYGSSWRSPLHDLELPSGETCQVKRPGVQGLIKAGVLHSLDTLTSIVQTETIPKAQGLPVKNDIKAIVEDPEKFGAMMGVVDKITLFVVTQPPLLSNLRPVLDENDEPVLKDGEPVMEEIPLQERDKEAVYVDYVDENDKMFIMQYAVGGSADLTEFREKTQALVGGLPARKSLKTRPSEIYSIEDEVTAWFFDRAVNTFGAALESRLHAVTEKTKTRSAGQKKAQQELDKWLSSADTKVAKGRFRDPMSSGKVRA
ncbi:tail assembly chaperone [Microbacterium phage RikSengupta]|nr:tail assembly chaperone [Microbacterium phage RikSengupta]